MVKVISITECRETLTHNGVYAVGIGKTLWANTGEIAVSPEDRKKYAKAWASYKDHLTPSLDALKEKAEKWIKKGREMLIIRHKREPGSGTVYRLMVKTPR